MNLYLYSKGQQTGPHTLDELHAVAKTGAIRPTDLVWQEGWQGWQPAATVPGLFTPKLPPAATVHPPIPHQGERVERTVSNAGILVSSFVQKPEVKEVVQQTARWLEAAKERTQPQRSIFDSDELKRRTKANGWAIAYWIGFGFFLPRTVHLVTGLGARGSPAANLLIVLSCFVSGILACRSWCRRRTYQIIMKKRAIEKFFVNIYLPSMWSYVWRSFVTFACIGLIIGWLDSLGSLRAEQIIGTSIGVLLFVWWLGSLFALPVPYSIKRRLKAAVEH